MEREHERDEFQQEIRRLEAQLRLTANVDNKGHRVRVVAKAVRRNQMTVHYICSV